MAQLGVLHQRLLVDKVHPLQLPVDPVQAGLQLLPAGGVRHLAGGQHQPNLQVALLHLGQLSAQLALPPCQLLPPLHHLLLLSPHLLEPGLHPLQVPALPPLVSSQLPLLGAQLLGQGLRIRIHFIRIRIQHFRLNTDPDQDPIRIRIQGFNDQKLEKITAEKKEQFLGSKTRIYLTLGLHKERPSYRRSLQASALKREAVQHFKS
jgi:hypothetical protein